MIERVVKLSAGETFELPDSAKQTAELLEQHGPNVLPAEKPVPGC
jgi:hypothetical protein